MSVSRFTEKIESYKKAVENLLKKARVKTDEILVKNHDSRPGEKWICISLRYRSIGLFSGSDFRTFEHTILLLRKTMKYTYYSTDLLLEKRDGK